MTPESQVLTGGKMHFHLESSMKMQDALSQVMNPLQLCESVLQAGKAQQILKLTMGTCKEGCSLTLLSS